MNTAFLSTGLTLALGSALTFAAFVGGGGSGPASEPRAFESATNRELDRRLDAVVNGSGHSTPGSFSALSASNSNAARPVSSGALDDSAERLTIRTVTTLLSLAVLCGMLIVIRKGLAGIERRARFASATASCDSRKLLSRTS
ncbi:MAG: hypothetical protein ABI565_04215 [Vicinamibacteria bacterium]